MLDGLRTQLVLSIYDHLCKKNINATENKNLWPSWHQVFFNHELAHELAEIVINEMESIKD